MASTPSTPTSSQQSHYLRTKQLHDAVIANQYSHAETLLKLKHCHVDCRNHFDYTALHFACIYGNVPMVTMLLQHGANIQAQANLDNGYTPLHFACWSGNLELVKLLLLKGANVHVEAASAAPSNQEQQLLRLKPRDVAFQRSHDHIVEYIDAEIAAFPEIYATPADNNFTLGSSNNDSNNNMVQDTSATISEQQVRELVTQFVKQISTVTGYAQQLKKGPNSSDANALQKARLEALKILAELITLVETKISMQLNTRLFASLGLKPKDILLPIHLALSDAYFEQGFICYEMQQFDDKALRSFDLSYKLNNQQITALNWKGYFLSKLRKYKPALECFEEVLKHQPQNPTALQFVAKLKNVQ